MAKHKTICVDLDGTLAHYDRWRGVDHFGEPIAGGKAALTDLKQQGWTIIIFTTRSDIDRIRQFLEKYEIPFDYINENPNQPADANGGKLIADVYVDDRAVQFNGDWADALHQIVNFEPWGKRSS
jgi:hydroxymethylpyrimidine pyrophosphatase-like HAD family hydrolase